jgi:hypothetical protein
MERSDDRGGGAARAEGAHGAPDIVKVPEYRLTRRDAYEAFLLVARVAGGPLRTLAEVILFIASLAMLSDLCFVSRDLRSLAMSALGTAAFLIVYSRPRLRARRTAIRAEGSGELGGMAVRGLDNDRIILNGGVTFPVTGHRLATAVDTGKHFIFLIIMTGGARVMILPKRVLSPDEILAVQSILARLDHDQKIRFL